MFLTNYKTNVPKIYDDFFTTRSLLDSFLSPIIYNSYDFKKENIEETEKEYNIELVLPGIDKNNLELNIEKDNLILSYKMNNNKKGYSYVKEFTKSWILPKDIELNKINAKYDNGILKIIIEKTKEIETKKIVVKID